jgi:hypothetical protein
MSFLPLSAPGAVRSNAFRSTPRPANEVVGAAGKRAGLHQPVRRRGAPARPDGATAVLNALAARLSECGLCRRPEGDSRRAAPDRVGLLLRLSDEPRSNPVRAEMGVRYHGPPTLGRVLLPHGDGMLEVGDGRLVDLPRVDAPDLPELAGAEV